MTNEQSRFATARDAALSSVMFPHNLAPATVSFSTYGHLLITGSEDMIRLAAEQLRDMASLTLLVTENVQNQDSEHLEKALNCATDLTVYSAKRKAVKGFLGQFQTIIEQNGETAELAKVAQNRATFDLILNLGEQNLFNTELPPAGYFHVKPESDQLNELIDELPGYIGEFDKPRYFQINNDICAHSSRGQMGCTRCLEVCPADAISSLNDKVEINPHLCHGAGGCATACPTGAINYALPQPQRLHEYLQRLLQNYLSQGGEKPVILFHDHEQGKVLVDQNRDSLAGNIIPVQLEEVAAAGQESWITCLASGAIQVLLLDTEAVPQVVRDLLNKEVSLTQLMLDGLGYNSSQLQLISSEQLLQISTGSDFKVIQPAALINQSEKRNTLFAAIDHLVEQAKTELPSYLALPAGAPFGQVAVNNTSCTLCMSCVAVCPTQSLTDGGEKPALNFTEQSCVQCGLCEGACPEKAITLEPRLLLTEQRSQRIEIHAEPAFECISCGKPFAPRSTVEKMIEKLSGHRMFQGPALNRLKMCEDCRVQDIYTDLSANPEKQLEL